MRRSSATSVDGHWTADGFDVLLAEAVVALSQLLASQGGYVKAAKAELHVLGEFACMRDFMHEVLEKYSDRQRMMEIFGGDCIRIARVRALCEAAQATLADQRLATCLAACVSIESVLVDLGLGERLRAAQARERLAMAAYDDGTLDECIKHLALATVFEAEAARLERAGDVTAALLKYADCIKELVLAIATAPEGSGDQAKLLTHLHQVHSRIQYLSGLRGAAPAVPVEQQIGSTSDLDLQKNAKHSSKLIIACAALGAAGGFLVLGPLGAVLGATYTAQAARREVSGTRLDQKFGLVQRLDSGFRQAVATSEGLDERYGVSEKLVAGALKAVSKTSELDRRYHVSDTVAARLQQAVERTTAHRTAALGIAGWLSAFCGDALSRLRCERRAKQLEGASQTSFAEGALS